MKKRKVKRKSSRKEKIESILAELEQKQILFSQKTVFKLKGAK